MMIVGLIKVIESSKQTLVEEKVVDDEEGLLMEPHKEKIGYGAIATTAETAATKGGEYHAHAVLRWQGSHSY